MSIEYCEEPKCADIAIMHVRSVFMLLQLNERLSAFKRTVESLILHLERETERRNRWIKRALFFKRHHNTISTCSCWPTATTATDTRDWWSFSQSAGLKPGLKEGEYKKRTEKVIGVWSGFTRFTPHQISKNESVFLHNGSRLH